MIRRALGDGRAAQTPHALGSIILDAEIAQLVGMGFTVCRVPLAGGRQARISKNSDVRACSSVPVTSTLTIAAQARWWCGCW